MPQNKASASVEADLAQVLFFFFFDSSEGDQWKAEGLSYSVFFHLE